MAAIVYHVHAARKKSASTITSGHHSRPRNTGMPQMCPRRL